MPIIVTHILDYNKLIFCHCRCAPDISAKEAILFTFLAWSCLFLELNLKKNSNCITFKACPKFCDTQECKRLYWYVCTTYRFLWISTKTLCTAHSSDPGMSLKKTPHVWLPYTKKGFIAIACDSKLHTMSRWMFSNLWNWCLRRSYTV